MARKSNRQNETVKAARKVRPLEVNIASERDIKEMLKDFMTSPAVKYVAAGISTALLSRFATRINDRYPEISTFIRDNIHTLEGKLEEYRDTMQSGFSQRH
jgi:hypothetical protein